MSKSFVVVAAAALIGAASLTVSAGAPQAAAQGSKTPVKPTAESQAKAKKIYALDCALCHGASGDGKTDLARDMQLTMADWTDSKTLSNAVDQELFNIIRNGKEKMPAEDVGRAKDDEVWNLIIYIRNLAKEHPAAPAQAPAPPPTPPAATPAPSNP